MIVTPHLDTLKNCNQSGVTMNQQTLAEIRQIEQLKYRYVRAIDTHDWKLLESLLAADIEVWFDGGALSQSGREKVVNFYKALLVPSFVSSHIVSQPEISIIGPSSATGIWRLQDTVYHTSDHTALQRKAGEKVSGAAYYYDKYRKEFNSWKICNTGFVVFTKR